MASTLSMLRSGNASVEFSTGALIGQLPRPFVVGLGWLFFRPSVSRAAPMEKKPGYYEFVTPSGTIGPFPRGLIEDMIKLGWVRPSPDNLQHCIGNYDALQANKPKLAAELKKYVARPK